MTIALAAIPIFILLGAGCGDEKNQCTDCIPRPSSSNAAPITRAWATPSRPRWIPRPSSPRTTVLTPEYTRDGAGPRLTFGRAITEGLADGF
jgi:hypothetical protein